MLVIYPDDLYKVKAIFAKYNSPLVYEEVLVKGGPLYCIKEGPASAILEAYLEYGIKDFKLDL